MNYVRPIRLRRNAPAALFGAALFLYAFAAMSACEAKRSEKSFALDSVVAASSVKNCGE